MEEHCYKTGPQLGIYTFEDAFDYYQRIAEKYSHIAPVKMLYTKGTFYFEYTKIISLDNGN